MKTKYNKDTFDRDVDALVVMECSTNYNSCNVTWKNLDTNFLASTYNQQYVYWNEQNLPLAGFIQVMVIQPGKYRLDNFRASVNNNMSFFNSNNSVTYTYQNDGKNNIIEFEVLPGEIVYLGNLYANLKSSLALYRALSIKDNYNVIMPAFDKAYPELEGKLKKKLFRFSRAIRYAKIINSKAGIINYKN